MADLVTNRLLLHPLSLTEAQALWDGRQTSLLWAGDYPVARTQNAAGFFCQRTRNPGWPNMGLFGIHQIVRQSDACVIGDVSYGALIGEEDALAIQYEVAPSAQCQGFASEAIMALVDWLLIQPSVRCIRAEILKGNEPSEKVARKAGLKYVRTVGDNGVFERCTQPNPASCEADLENRR